jgi:hypothetical protein
MILTGEIQDRLEAQHATEVATKRMGGDRGGRAWKFFQPKPSSQTLLRVAEVESRKRDVAMMAGGINVLLVCLFEGPKLLFGVSVVLFGISILLYAGGAFAMVRYALPRFALMHRWHGQKLDSMGGAWSQSRDERHLRDVEPTKGPISAPKLEQRVNEWFTWFWFKRKRTGGMRR